MLSAGAGITLNPVFFGRYHPGVQADLGCSTPQGQAGIARSIWAFFEQTARQCIKFVPSETF